MSTRPYCAYLIGNLYSFSILEKVFGATDKKKGFNKKKDYFMHCTGGLTRKGRLVRCRR